MANVPPFVQSTLGPNATRTLSVALTVTLNVPPESIVKADVEIVIVGLELSVTGAGTGADPLVLEPPLPPQLTINKAVSVTSRRIGFLALIIALPLTRKVFRYYLQVNLEFQLLGVNFL